MPQCAAALSSTTLALPGGVQGDVGATSEAGDVVLRDGTSDLRAEAADVLWLAAEQHRAKLRMRAATRDAAQAAAARADRLRWAAMSPSQRDAVTASSHATRSTASALDLLRGKGQLPTNVSVAGPLRAGREGPAFVSLQRPVLAPVYSLSSSGST